MNWFYNILKSLRTMANEKDTTQGAENNSDGDQPNEIQPEMETENTPTETPPAVGNNGQGFPPVDIITENETVTDEPKPNTTEHVQTELIEPMKKDEPTAAPVPVVPAAPEKKKKKDDNTILIIAVVLGVLIIGAFVYWNYTRKKTQLESDADSDKQNAVNNDDDYESKYFQPANDRH